SYLLASGLFIFSLRWLSRPETARRGVAAGVAGMTLAIVGTLLHPEVAHYEWIAVAVVVGTIIGVPLPRVPVTAVPQAAGVARRGPRRRGEVQPLAPGRRAHPVPHVRDRGRGDPRLRHPDRQPDGRGQAAGGDPDPADRLSRPERDQPVPARDRGRRGDLARG